MRVLELVVRISIVFIGLSCMQPASGSGPVDTSKTTPPSGNSREADWAAIEALENQAKAIAKTTGCARDAECRSAPVGNRGCGGPRYYIAYCAATTDSVALFRKLDEVKAAENAFNAKYNVVSTCEFRMPPAVGVASGVCAAR